MGLSTLFQENASHDPTWSEAFNIVRRQLPVPSHVFQLFKSGWNGCIDPIEYIKIMGFSRLNPVCLVRAADMDENNLSTAAINHSIEYLGIRFSAVVLAINYTSRAIVKRKPPPGWEKLFREMMTCTEIGYKLGGHTPEIGVEGGALMGFARWAGLGLLMSDKPKQFTKYKVYENKRARVRLEQELELFGCSAYQVAALAIQQLGFGTEVAIGMALGSSALSFENHKFDRNVLCWRAAYHWTAALRDERNYPAELAVRSFFPEIDPGATGDRNMNLEILHTEVGKVIREGSSWTWHLPKGDYDKTRTALGFNVVANGAEDSRIRGK